MYSVVLMAVLATSTATPGWHGRCHCYSASSCHGCHAPAQGYGCAGACYGYHGGCYGAGYSTYNAQPNYYPGCTGCYGCYGGHSCYGVPVPMVPGREPEGKDPFPPINPPKMEDKGEEVGPLKEKTKKKEEKPKKEKASIEDGGRLRAKIRIDIPEGGKLFVDGRHINVGAGTRTFASPPLAAGELYFYDIRIEVERDGQIRNDQRRVIIRSGQDLAVNFPSLHGPTTLTAQVPR